jgi:hypothetical protein
MYAVTAALVLLYVPVASEKLSVVYVHVAGTLKPNRLFFCNNTRLTFFCTTNSSKIIAANFSKMYSLPPKRAIPTHFV